MSIAMKIYAIDAKLFEPSTKKNHVQFTVTDIPVVQYIVLNRCIQYFVISNTLR